MKNKTDLYSASATPDEVRDSVLELFRNYEFASKILPVSWLVDAITDLVAATAFDHAGRRGDAMRRFMTDLHRELADAHERCQKRHVSEDRASAKPVPFPRALVG
jgi:hypothetical protein